MNARADAEAEVAIHKVLSRGARADAQVLLVLLSVATPPRAGDALFVTAGPGTPQRLWAESPSECTEAARPVDWDELEALDLQRADQAPPFDLDRALPRWFGLARFDLSDHPWLEAHWRTLCQPADGAVPAALVVTAWRAWLGRNRADGDKDYDAWLPDGAQQRVEVALADVVAQPLFELGVLFVHGIGDHQPRETLVHWAEPIVAFWRERARAIVERAADDTPSEVRTRLRQSVKRGQLRNRAPIDGIVQAMDDFVERRSARAAPQPDDGAAAVPCVLSVRPEQTLFNAPDPAQPSAALWRISSIDSRAVLRESHVLLAEAYWTRETFPPTFKELFTWLITAVPVTVWARMRRLVSQRPMELWEQLKQARSTFEAVRWAVAVVLFLWQLCWLPAAYVLGAWVVQLAVGLVGLAGVLVPIPWVRTAARTVMNALLGTVGQSQALQTSPLRRSAIVSAVEARLKLGQRSLPEGRGVVALPGCRSQPARLRRAPPARTGALVHLRCRHCAAGHAEPEEPGDVQVEGGRLQLARRARGAGPGARCDGHRAGTGRESRCVGLVVVALAGPVMARRGARLPELVVLRGVSGRQRTGPGAQAEPATVRDRKMARLLRLARPSAPGGSLIDRFRADLVKDKIPVPLQHRIFNTRFALLDHTSYFRNLEQFVAPIALELLRLAGLGTREELEGAELKHASKRRDLLTWWTMLGVDIALFAAAAMAAWVAFGPTQRGAAWLAAARPLWSRPEGLGDRLLAFWREGLVSSVATDLWPALAVLLGLAALAVPRALLGHVSGRRLVQGLARAARRQK